MLTETKHSLVRSSIWRFMVCAAIASSGCAANEAGSIATGAAGSSAEDVGVSTQDLLARRSLYQSCSPGGSNLQGDCGSGLVCQTIIHGGFRCYRSAANGCRNGTQSYMGVACLETCDPIRPGGSCTFPRGCHIGWCVP
jgi:hypothetical protein